MKRNKKNSEKITKQKKRKKGDDTVRRKRKEIRYAWNCFGRRNDELEKEAEDGRANVIPFPANTVLPFHSEFNQNQKRSQRPSVSRQLALFPVCLKTLGEDGAT